MSVRRLLGRLFLSLSVLGAALVMLELGLERWFPVGGVVYRLDDELLHDARPHASRIQPMPRSQVREGDAAYVAVRTGPEGFRGAGLRPAGARPRMLVLGDSLVMAENVPEESTFVVQLGRALEESLGLDEGDIESVNGGRSGYGPGQSLRFLERVAPTVCPDVVVFVICAHNDLGDLARNKLFFLEGDELVRGEPRVAPHVSAWFEANAVQAARPALLRALDALRGGPVQAEVLRGDPLPLYLAALEQQWQDMRGPRAVLVDSLFQDVYDADVALGRDVSHGGKAALLTAVADRVLQLEARPELFGLDRAAPVHFVVVPSAIDVCRRFGITIDQERYPDYVATQLASTCSAAISAAGARRVHNLDPMFRGLDDPDAHFVGGTDIHWNGAGQGAAATHLARQIVADPASRARLESGRRPSGKKPR